MFRSKLILVFVFTLIIIATGVWIYISRLVDIEHITFNASKNPALEASISIALDGIKSIHLQYWEKDTFEVYKTPITNPKKEHEIYLPLLKPNTTYNYRVFIGQVLKRKTKVLNFQTDTLPTWKNHKHWVRQENKKTQVLNNGLVMVSHRGSPGYIVMLDSEGITRWYWQDSHLGVRIAKLTPRNTILVLLAPPSKDDFNKYRNQTNTQDVRKYYLRTGKIGFLGGTEIVEIDLSGKVLWRLKTKDKGFIFHHGILMNKKSHIVGICRDYKLHTIEVEGKVIDTLWGDAIVEIDTLGNTLNKWSAWSNWDIAHDNKIQDLYMDRFHFNSLAIDSDGNYLVSTPIENQIWKVNSSSGKLIWKFGKGGDFKMDSSDFFYFQHDVQMDTKGRLILFDNGNNPNDSTPTQRRVSRTRFFELDDSQMTAKSVIDAPLPSLYYTARMGGVSVLPDGNMLQTSSKTGVIAVTDSNGEILWSMRTPFISYKVEYIPLSVWSEFFDKAN